MIVKTIKELRLVWLGMKQVVPERILKDERDLFDSRRVVFVDDLLKMDLLSKEQHDALVNEMGFKKVKTRCPVCYTEGMIKRNVEEMIK